MLTAIITAACSILTAIVVALVTYALTRRREREAEWRKLKFSQYQEFLLALSGIVEGRSSPVAQARYSDAVNSMALVAPSPILCALHDYVAENSYRNANRSVEQHDRLLNILLREMRADMLAGKGRDVGNFEFRLLATPPAG